MRVIDAQQIASSVRMGELIEALRTAFVRDWSAPLRQAAPMPGGTGDRLFLSMPAFDAEGAVTKLVTIFPDNAARRLPTIHAAIVVFSATGEPVALLDGALLTRMRTAAASAVAASYLARPDASSLVLVGTGSLAPYMALAHSCVRPIARIEVWGRNEARAQETARAVKALLERDIEVTTSSDLRQSLQGAHVVSCATNSRTPVLAGEWIQPGTHVDLVGAYSHDMRESDDALITRARIFVDTFEGALAEAGDILDPLHRGVITREHVEAELKDLIAGTHRGRETPAEVTLFKSVGAAVEDLVAARLAISKR